jgi:hypothetical protein
MLGDGLPTMHKMRKRLLLIELLFLVLDYRISYQDGSSTPDFSIRISGRKKASSQTVQLANSGMKKYCTLPDLVVLT